MSEDVSEGLYRIVECRPARLMPLPVMLDGRVPPLCRSSIERFQDLDLSKAPSVLFSTQSPSYLQHQGNKISNQPYSDM